MTHKYGIFLLYNQNCQQTCTVMDGWMYIDRIGRCCSAVKIQTPLERCARNALHCSNSMRLYSNEPPAKSKKKKRDVVDVTRTKKRVKANAVFLTILLTNEVPERRKRK